MRNVAVLAVVLWVVAPFVDAQVETDAGSTTNAGIMADDAEAEGDSKDNTSEGAKGKGPNFIPIPIFVTEPAIGYGLGAALGYFHPKNGTGDSAKGSLEPALTAETAARAGRQQKVPPTISGIAAAYTDKGTWGAGVAHSASWSKDTIRYAGAVGYAHVVSTFYFDNQPFDFKLDTALLYQDIKFRIRSSDFFVGAKLAYINPDLTFDEDLGNIPVDTGDTKLNDFGLALQADFDGRDNNTTPNRGQFIELVVWKHLEVLGGETDYSRIGLQAQSFHEMMNTKLVLGFHLDLDAVGGEPPFWGFPWVVMRGVPALRYQNEDTAVVETELRWNLTERWAGVGFVGVAATRGDVPQYEDESGIVAGGIGGRYLFRPQDGLWVGIDVAQGPEDTILYIQVGHAW